MSFLFLCPTRKVQRPWKVFSLQRFFWRRETRSNFLPPNQVHGLTSPIPVWGLLRKTIFFVAWGSYLAGQWTFRMFFLLLTRHATVRRVVSVCITFGRLWRQELLCLLLLSVLYRFSLFATQESAIWILKNCKTNSKSNYWPAHVLVCLVPCHQFSLHVCLSLSGYTYIECQGITITV